jgi:hypothetical protein
MDLKPSCPLSLYIDLRAQLDSLFSFPFSVGLTQQDVLRRFVFLEQDKKSGGRSWSAASTAAAKVSASPPSLSLSLSLFHTHMHMYTRVNQAFIPNSLLWFVLCTEITQTLGIFKPATLS